jgi:hypothetical protein
MTNQKHEIKNAVCECLNELADGSFKNAGFVRRPDSLRYERKLADCVQWIDVTLEHGPKDNGNAAAAIYPWLSVSIDDVDKITARMTNGDESLVSSSASTLRQPIELLSPKGVGARWFIYQADSIRPAVDEFVEYAKKWLFSFLDSYSSPNGVVSAFESHDSRVINVQEQFLRVVASLILLGRQSAAKTLLDSKFGRPAMRRKFASVFSYVDQELAGSLPDAAGK